jgi:hypothetical protein
MVQTVGWLWARLAPNRQGRGRVTHVTARLNKKGQDFKSKWIMTSGGRWLYNRLNQNPKYACAIWCDKGSYGIDIYDRGLGLSPSPDPRANHTQSNLNIYKTIYIIRTHVWYVGSADFAKALHGGEVRGSIPMDSITFKPTTNNRVPRGSPRLGHVAPNHWTENATCQQTIHPHLPTNECHVSYGPANSALPRVVRTCHVSIRTDCTVNIPFFCLFDVLNRT